MARPLREEVAGGYFHVYARGVRGERIFLDDYDRHAYLRLLDGAVRHRQWDCLAYCLMDNHVHLVTRTPEPNLAAGMQSLHGAFAQRFNRRHGYSGHLFEGRYGCRSIKSDEQLWVTLRYVALNPVEAGLCAHPDDYPWSSHSRLVDGESPSFIATHELLSHFAGLGEPLARYRRFIGYALLKGSDPLGWAA